MKTPYRNVKSHYIECLDSEGFLDNFLLFKNSVFVVFGFDMRIENSNTDSFFFKHTSLNVIFFGYLFPYISCSYHFELS